jgi:type II secretory ATPase GspE/PulE/Tfp pilus assembly ATPase PilB-like protein
MSTIFSHEEEKPDSDNVQFEETAGRDWLDNLLAEAIERRTSDIHLDPGKKSARMRLRVDGMLYDLQEYDMNLHSQIVSKIKVLANMDIANTHFPQDGQFEHLYNDRTHYLRVSSYPTIYGEAVVMRVLNRVDSYVGMDSLGLDKKQFNDVMNLISNPFGMVLTTGPTGSGKSTFLNSILNHLNDGHKNIITVEDPVEYRIEGVRQTQVNRFHKLDFAEALRAILRQDPDVVMIGEIRDAQTAQTAVRAALTGRLFFSTFHTLDVFAILARFIEMDIPRSVVAHVIGGVVSTRLVRQICVDCKAPYRLTDNEAYLLNGVFPENTTLYKGKGCERCSGTGYYGTTGIFEVVVFDDEIRSAILRSAPEEDIRALLAQKGVKSLLGSGIDKVAQGITSPSEVIRVTGGKVE